MKVTEIQYKRVINLGNYENEQIQVSASIEEGDNLDTVFAYLKQFVERSSVELVEREKREKEMQERLEKARQAREAAQLRQEQERREEENEIDEYEGEDDEDEEEVSF